ncbi:CGNR zinc finger domain-containing protein [Chryseolinea sp. T2]|uniref:CGNR zinc finger domain-containing protein n=1 Tax=Chryseolinea sp. T2 TaxID=3129255 RepID=UPI003076D79F
MKIPAIDDLRLDGGALCLDYVNTVPDRKDGSGRDLVKSFHELLYWARKAKAIESSAFTTLERAAAERSRGAKEFFTQAIQLRTLIYDLFYPLSQKQRIKPTDLDSFNKVMARYSPHLQMAAESGEIVLRWAFDADQFLRITGPIVKSAQDVLLSGKLERIKECPRCGWLFLDTSKNGMRRWCSMEDCGSNAKSLHYYYRKREERSEE